MTDSFYMEMKPPQMPIERKFRISLDGDVYEVLQGLNNLQIKRQCYMKVKGKGDVPYWYEIRNRDEFIKVMDALDTMSHKK